jgi:hypothetical protein
MSEYLVLIGLTVIIARSVESDRVAVAVMVIGFSVAFCWFGLGVGFKPKGKR